MPRRKNLTQEEKLVFMNQEIVRLENRLSELKQEKIELEEQIKMKNLKELDEMMTKTVKHLTMLKTGLVLKHWFVRKQKRLWIFQSLLF